jgi:hypothetical protein
LKVVGYGSVLYEGYFVIDEGDTIDEMIEQIESIVWSYIGIDQPFYNLFFVGFGSEEMFQADT